MQILRLAFAAMLISSPLAQAQQPPELQDNGLYLQTASSGFAPATRLTTEFDVKVTGIIARVSVSQRFLNASNDWVEGVYVFPLPDDAAVDELSMQIGDRRIEGEIQERNQAKQTYERARAAGQQASLVEQERPNLFTTSVANVAPGQEIVIAIGYLQTVDYEDGAFELRLPMTLTPRFNPQGVADARRIAPPAGASVPPDSHLATVEIAIDAGLPIAEAGSTSHELTDAWDGQIYRLTSGDRQIPIDRELIVNWSVVSDQTPQVAAFTESVGTETFVQLMFVPPATAELQQTSPRELVFVIDTSGSMGGNSIARARTALQAALGRLTPNDRFNVIEFNSNAGFLYAAPVEVNSRTIADARRFVSRLGASGGTNIAAAIEMAMGQQTTPGYLRQIVFMTDGSVGNEAELFAEIRQRLGAARMFTVGIGSAPNSHFLRKAAQFGRGSYLQINSAGDVEDAMRQLFMKLERIALTDIEINWPESFEVFPERIPDLYRGEPVVVVGRVRGSMTRELSLAASGKIGPYDWSDNFRVRPGTATGVASIWARRKIESLIDSRLDGANEESIRTAVIDVALAHGILSPYTSLVAVDLTPEITRNARLRREALASLAPAGSNVGARLIGLPGTATDSRLYQLIGTLLTALLLGLTGLLRLTRRRIA